MLKDREISTSSLSQALSNIGFHISTIAEMKFYALSMAFSNEAYLEIAVFIPRVDMAISLSSPDRKKVEKLVETALASLTT